MQAPIKSPSDAPYSERLYVAWWACLLPLVAAALLAAAVANALQPAFMWIPFVVGVILAVTLLVLMSRTPVVVDAEMLQVGKARLPLRWVGDVEVIKVTEKRVTMGPRLDPFAYVQHRPWIGPMIKVTLTDPDDETPYWLFSTRHPDRLAEVLRQR